MHVKSTPNDDRNFIFLLILILIFYIIFSPMSKNRRNEKIKRRFVKWNPFFMAVFQNGGFLLPLFFIGLAFLWIWFVWTLLGNFYKPSFENGSVVVKTIFCMIIFYLMMLFATWWILIMILLIFVGFLYIKRQTHKERFTLFLIILKALAFDFRKYSYDEIFSNENDDLSNKK